MLSRRQLPRVHGTTREGNYEAISRASGTRPQRHREPGYVPLCASAPLWPIIEPLLCRNRGLNRTRETCGSAPKQKTAPVLKCQVVQKWCRNGAVLPPCAVREPKLVHFRSGTGGGIRFPEDRGGVEATRRVKLNGAENENRYKNGTETFRNVRAGWVSHWGMDWRFRSRRLGTKIGPKSVRFWGGSFVIRRGVHCRSSSPERAKAT